MDADAFHPLVDPARVGSTGCCWIWSGPLSVIGKPVLYARNRQYSVRKLQMEHRLGRDVPRGHLTHVWCDTHSCVRPDHLYVSHWINDDPGGSGGARQVPLHPDEVGDPCTCDVW